MRFLAFVFAMMALFSPAVNAGKILGYIEFAENGAINTYSSVEELHLTFVGAHTDSAVHKEHTASKKESIKVATRDFLGAGYTQIHVSSVWDTDVFASLYIERETSPNVWAPTQLVFADFYGSHFSWASSAAIDTTKLIKISKAVEGVGQYEVRGASADGNLDPLLIQSANQGTSPKYWPVNALYAGENPLYPAAVKTFPYLFVKLVTPVSQVQGNIRYTLYDNSNDAPPCTTPGGCGDPQFVGLQGQSFQFHGMADEVFSLVSAPEMQINALFKFISTGNCDYNDTMCWSHPGTYLGQIGVQYGNDKILLQSGAHSAGMKVFINDKEVTPSKHIHQFASNSNSSAIAQFKSTSKFTFNSDKFFITFHNSDYFFNFDFGLKDSQILQAGAKQMRVTGEICERESRMHKTLLADTKTQIKGKLSAAYPAYPLHGLVGQTWRNAEFCGRYFEGTVDDYVVGSLFGNEHTFNYFSH